MKLVNKKLSQEEFFAIRKEVLQAWETGKAVEDIYAGIEYAKNIPASKNFAIAMENAKREGKTLVQPRAGVALVDLEIQLLNHLSAAGADLLPNTIDSYTRQNRYKNCQIGIEESIANNRSMLNGFPAVNHGVEGCRRVLESVDKPLQARHGTPDARLLSEIIYASGWTSNEGGGISYNIPYSKNVSLEQTLRDWQYIDRLTGFYEEHGVKINREPYGPLTGTLVPPSTSNSVAIIEALLAAEQGVKNLTVGYGQCGNLIQDVAAIRSLQSQCEEYMAKYGYNDTVITTVFHQWMGGFPADEAKAFGLISLGATAAAYSGAHKVIVKTPHESIGIPTKEANADGIKATKTVVKLLGEQLMPMNDELAREIDIIKKETACIIDEVFRLGNGDLCQGVIAGIRAGVIDIPFAPSAQNKGAAMPARDFEGKIRYVDTGFIPFTQELKDFNAAALGKRAQMQNREKADFNMTVDDIFAVSDGVLIGTPKVVKR